jgi:hypothetical protein
MEYQIVVGQDPEDLMKNVEDFMAGGWRAKGGVALGRYSEGADPEHDWPEMFQAMTRDAPAGDPDAEFLGKLIRERFAKDLLDGLRRRGITLGPPRMGEGVADLILRAIDERLQAAPAMGQQWADVVIPQPHARAAIVVEALIGDTFEASSPQDEMGIRGRGRSTAEAIGKLILHRGRALGIDVELPK